MSSQQEKMDINRVGFGNKLWMLKIMQKYC